MAVNTRYSFKNITSNATTVVAKGPGVLHTVVVNTTAASAVTIYDGVDTTGTKIGTWAVSMPLGTTLLYDVGFSVGLTIVTAGSPDLTVSFG